MQCISILFVHLDSLACSHNIYESGRFASFTLNNKVDFVFENYFTLDTFSKLIILLKYP